MKTLDGKVALITGAGRGIGREIAYKLAGEGAQVLINDLDEKPLKETADTIKDNNGESALCVGDITESGFGDRFTKKAIDTFGGIDIIVNNAGFTWDTVIQKMTDEQWQTILDVHLTAPFRILRSASEFIRLSAKKEAKAGTEVFRKVVNVSSISGLYGNAGQVNYSTAKAGLVGMTRALAKEWGRYKVNVNCVAFGIINTRLAKPLNDEDAFINVQDKKIEIGIQPHVLNFVDQIIPLGRKGTPKEAANAVYLFCTPESNYISGQFILCGGGLII